MATISSSNLVTLMSELKARRLVLPLLVALVLALLVNVYWPVLSGERNYYISDHTFYFQPFTEFIARSLRNWHLPLWNPYLYAGMSQIAVPSPGIFYLPNVVFALLPYSQAMACLMILHQLLTACGAFLFIASLGWGVAAAFAGALIMSLCGYMFSLTTNYSLVATASWIPLFFYLITRMERSISEENRRLTHFIVCGTSLCFAMLACAGRPEISMPGCFIVFVFCVRRIVQRGKASAAFIAYLALAVTLGALLAMPVILPVEEWHKLSPRSHGLNIDQAMMWSTNWYDLICMFFAQPLGDLQILGAPYLKEVATRPVYMPYVPSTYIGPVALTLAIIGFFDKTWRWRLFAFTGLTVALVLCMGEYTPVTPYLVQHCSLLAAIRYPVKWIVYPLFLLALAAARGLSCVLRRSVEKTALLSAVAFYMSALFFAAAFEIAALRNVELHLVRAHLPPGMAALLATALLIGSVLGIISSILVYFANKSVLAPPLAALLVAVLLGCNLYVNALYFRQNCSTSRFYTHTSTLREKLISIAGGELKNERFLPLYFDPLSVPLGYRWESGAGWNASFFQYAREILLPNANVGLAVPESFGYEAGETGFYRNAYLNIMHQCPIAEKVTKGKPSEKISPSATDYSLFRFCQSTATHWIATQITRDEADLPLLDARYFTRRLDDARMNIRLYSLCHALPRAYFSPYWSWMESDDALKEAVIHPSVSGFNPASVSLIERNEDNEKQELASNPLAPKIGPPPKTAPPSPVTVADDAKEITEVAILQDEPEHVAISTDSKKDGFLVLCDHFYPGWTALVDSLPRPIYKANCEMRAVWLPKGEHLVEFNYTPDSLKTGALLCLAAMSVLGVLILEASGPFLLKLLKMMAGQA